MTNAKYQILPNELNDPINELINGDISPLHFKLQLEIFFLKLRDNADNIEYGIPDISLTDYTDPYDNIIGYVHNLLDLIHGNK